MNPYHAKLLPQLPPRPIVATAAITPQATTLTNSSGFRGGGNNPNPNAGGSGAIGFGNDGGGGGGGRNQQQYNNQRGPQQQYSSSSSASARGVVFFTVKPGEHPATINGLRGKIAVDYATGATTEEVLNQIAEMHQISRSKFTVTATEQSRGMENLKPTDRIMNYDRITVSVVPADMGGSGGGAGGISGNNNLSTGGGMGHATSSGGISAYGARGNNKNNNITIIDDEDGGLMGGRGGRITSPTSSTSVNVTSSVHNVLELPCISLEREAVLSSLDIPLNLPVLDRPEETTVMAGKKPLCTLCGEAVVVSAAGEFTFTSAESMQTHCCLRFACEQCCQYTVDVLGASADHCPICNSLTDEALAKSVAANNHQSSTDVSSFFPVKKFATEVNSIKGETVVPTVVATPIAGVKRERDEGENHGEDAAAGTSSTAVNHGQQGKYPPGAVVEGVKGQTAVEETREESSSDDDDDDDLLDGGGTLMF